MPKYLLLSSASLLLSSSIRTGEVLWTVDYKSPIVALYSMNADGLHKLPFYTMASETLSHLTGQMAVDEWRQKFLLQGRSQVLQFV